MIATFVTWPYAFYQNEPAILLGLSQDGQEVRCVISITTNGEMKVVDHKDLKIDVDRLRKINL